MYRFQTVTIAKLTLAASTNSSGSTVSCCIRPKACKFVTPLLTLLSGQRYQAIHTSSRICAATNLATNSNIFRRSYDAIRFHLFTKHIYKAKGFLLYRHSIDGLDYMKFIDEYRMPDTFFSWFIITELHVWMLMVRLMAAGKDGMEVRRHLVAAMWQDVDTRRKKLGGVKASTVVGHLNEMGLQFNAAIIGYDEGLMSNDQVLAGAVWRRFLQSECNNPEQVEKLVIYVRKTINMLDNLPNQVLTGSTKLQWLDTQSC